jgi:cystathionine beta-lyase
VPYDLRHMRSKPHDYRGIMVRLCIGLEAVDDLIADLVQAMRVLRG